MTLLEGTKKLGAGKPTTEEAHAVDCPHCRNSVFTNTIGVVRCDSCGHEFNAQNHHFESCSAVECENCEEVISFIQEHRLEIMDWETYYCHFCDSILAVETDDGTRQLEDFLGTGWITNHQFEDSDWIEFDQGHRAKPVQTEREQFATKLLNIEAKANESSFYPYIPGEVDAYLCFTEDYCIGYITWNQNYGNPELGQLYLLPKYRQQGIGSAFVDAWRSDVAGSAAEFRVNNPNPNMFRLLRSIGVIKITEGEIDHPNCGIVGSYNLPDEWRELLDE